ncbi:MAG: YebC/PmpR family DNA-binding transcriptional regulator, partial [Victivallales bacterium]|nr:YebC/PmpR family DNA-binding transcriptional regulator [Victivallales bacterium]
YEGYGSEGVAVLIECLTDNRNRSASDVRMTLDRNCGNLATSGAVSWMFHRQAHFVVTGENADEEILMDIVLDAGAEDIDVEDGVAEIWGPPESLGPVMEALEKAGIVTEEAGLVRRPENTIELKDADKAKQVLRLIDRLEDLDDVQEVTANFEIDDSIADQVEID